MVSSRNGVSTTELYRYEKCRFDRLERLLSGESTSGPNPTTTPSPSTPPSGGTGTLSLPRVPWEGGPAYWKKYALAAQQHMDDPSYFPIANFYNLADNDEQARYDWQTVGLNTYVQGNSARNASGVAAQGFKTFHSGPRQIGSNLDDEVDGRFELQAGLNHIKALTQKAPSGSANLVGWTSGVVSYDRSTAFSEAYINNPGLALNALDQYFYSVPQCSWGDGRLRWRTPTEKVNSRGVPGTTIVSGNCRTASSYGKVIDLQREIDNNDGALKPIWGTVEVAGIGGNRGDWNIPTGQQVKAAAFNSIIHEARGIIWFDQAPENGNDNDCPSAGAFRDARLGWGHCAAVAANVKAVGEFNAQVKRLAPVLNTQGFEWNFGQVDTMLKVHDGFAYVFAAPLDGKPGDVRFTLPNGINGVEVEVVDENRRLPISGGTFSDAFAAESSYHIYRIALG